MTIKKFEKIELVENRVKLTRVDISEFDIYFENPYSLNKKDLEDAKKLIEKMLCLIEN